MLSRITGLLLVLAVIPALPQAVPAFPLRMDGPVLRQPAQATEPFTVAGTHGLLVGQQQGIFEAWVLPVKLLSHFTLEAQVEGYPVPLDLNTMAREIEVRPDRTIITYSHIAVVVRQIMFAPSDSAPIVLFQVDSARPVTLTFRFTPEMRPMWPAPDAGIPSPEWVGQGATGFYALHTDDAAFTGAVTIPGAVPGIMAPYQERPQVHPLELILHTDPKNDRNKFFPLLMAVGQSAQTATTSALAKSLATVAQSLPSLYAAHAAAWEKQEATQTYIVTPDPTLNEAFTWAETSIEQLKARAPSGELGLVAGYYASGDSARPGFGWFFGRDTLYTLYAVNSFGDFALSRAALDFLIHRQRADGKMPHEYSQTAASVDWQSLPYEYAAADSTPLFLTTMLDYVNASGDTAYLRANKDAVLKAWHFETTHDADGDGIYDNAEGTGWVESWPPGMPKQEIYLALLDQQASVAMSTLAGMLDAPALGTLAAHRAQTLSATIEREYYQPATHTYAFSHNPTADPTNTIFPSIAWWNAASLSATPDQPLTHPQDSLRNWASHDFSTDWGARDVAASDPLYDPISYHQGSVWPLFTGWASIAQYRSNHPLAGYAALMQNAGLTTAQDLGAVTELLSGDFFEPFGRSTSHQLWSSAMVVTPILRGLFGLAFDAPRHTLKVNPQLPAAWDHAELNNLHVGTSTANLSMRREGATLVVALKTLTGPAVHLVGSGSADTLQLPLPAFEVSLAHESPLPGDRTHQPKVLAEAHTSHSLHLEIEGIAGTQAHLALRRNHPALTPKIEGATLTNNDLVVTFPAGTGYQAQAVTLTW